jgi:hypothetical protein
MAVVNRCAIGVGPRPPLLEWARKHCSEEQMASVGEEHGLYLIPTYDTPEEGMALLAEGYEAIVEAELELWCRDRGAWPSSFTFALFQEWFEIRFYPLIQDLCGEELEVLGIEEEFVEEVRVVLQDGQPFCGD